MFSSFLISNGLVGQSSAWEKPFAGNDPSDLFCPNQRAEYLRYGWENKPGVSHMTKGKMPEARCFSFNFYNDSTKSSIATLAYYEIKPEAGDNTIYIIYIMHNHGESPYQCVIIQPDAIKIASDFLASGFATYLGDTSKQLRYFSI